MGPELTPEMKQQLARVDNLIMRLTYVLKDEPEFGVAAAAVMQLLGNMIHLAEKGGGKPMLNFSLDNIRRVVQEHRDNERNQNKGRN